MSRSPASPGRRIAARVACCLAAASGVALAAAPAASAAEPAAARAATSAAAPSLSVQLVVAPTGVVVDRSQGAAPTTLAYLLKVKASIPAGQSLHGVTVSLTLPPGLEGTQACAGDYFGGACTPVSGQMATFTLGTVSSTTWAGNNDTWNGSVGAKVGATTTAPEFRARATASSSEGETATSPDAVTSAAYISAISISRPPAPTPGPAPASSPASDPAPAASLPAATSTPQAGGFAPAPVATAASADQAPRVLGTSQTRNGASTLAFTGPSHRLAPLAALGAALVLIGSVLVRRSAAA